MNIKHASIFDFLIHAHDLAKETGASVATFLDPSDKSRFNYRLVPQQERPDDNWRAVATVSPDGFITEAGEQ